MMKKIVSAWIVPVTLLLGFWLLKLAETVYDIDLRFLGVYPRELKGLAGIITAPFIHGSFEHLIANSLAFLLLSTALFYFYKGVSIQVFIYTWIFSGLFIWLVARPAWHIGVSGVIHGLFAFLFMSGLLRRSKELIAISLLSVFLYGGMVWGFIPEFFPGKNVSFEGHGGGLLAGLVLAIVYRKKGPQKKEYQWNDDETDIPYQKSTLKIVIDKGIPFIKGVFEPFAYTQYLDGHKISSSDVFDADALVVRTRTKCDKKLLEASSVKFIATATIGYDHIDVDYCKKNNIHWANAPGCNSSSVMQYVAAVLSMLALEKGFNPQGKKIGIIGVGHVGKKVAFLAELFGMKPLLYDPPRALREGFDWFTNLETIQSEADIISFHVPLKYIGQDATHHFADEYFFRNLKKNPFIINTSRGEVVDESALMNALSRNLIAGYVLDVFENEPKINKAVIEKSFISTPHIAGYSCDGKANGTSSSVREVSRFLNLPLSEWEVPMLPKPDNPLIYSKNYDGFWLLVHAVLSTYNIAQDDYKLRSHPEQFEFFRNNYPNRREFEVFTVVLQKHISSDIREKLKALGFHISDHLLN
ncbi:MAG: rhomboid family intramembrane serine protease [Bacteroidales bacterium]|jgi:erythronate-4-phosphate dehydrogenase|nr:rhomboid family intramembrane serine protease [Bacteroidales bacterium]